MNIFIWATKSIDKGVLGIKALEQWHRQKVHKIALMWYLREEKIEVLCQEIEFSIGIKLKTTPCLLISEAHLEECIKTKNGRGSPIVIIVRNKADAYKLYAKGLKFGRVSKKVEKFWEARPIFVYKTYSSITHD